MFLNNIFKPTKSKQIEALKYEVLHLRSELKRQVDWDKRLQLKLNKYHNAKAVQYDSEDEVYTMNLFVSAVMETLIAYESGKGKLSAKDCLDLLKKYLTDIAKRDIDVSDDLAGLIKEQAQHTHNMQKLVEQLRELFRNNRSKGQS